MTEATDMPQVWDDAQIDWDGCSYFFRINDKDGRLAFDIDVSLCWCYLVEGGRMRVADVDICRNHEVLFHENYDEVDYLDEGVALRLAREAYKKMMDEYKQAEEER